MAACYSSILGILLPPTSFHYFALYLTYTIISPAAMNTSFHISYIIYTYPIYMYILYRYIHCKYTYVINVYIHIYKYIYIYVYTYIYVCIYIYIMYVHAIHTLYIHVRQNWFRNYGKNNNIYTYT